MEDLVADANAPWRFALTLMALFAAMAVLITIVGLYGVISYTVSNRTREIGIRVTLGAPRVSVLRLVLGQTATMIALGAVLGVAGAVSLSRVFSSLLFQVEPTADLLEFAGGRRRLVEIVSPPANDRLVSLDCAVVIRPS